jgi:hypothetical protein
MRSYGAKGRAVGKSDGESKNEVFESLMYAPQP